MDCGGYNSEYVEYQGLARQFQYGGSFPGADTVEKGTMSSADEQNVNHRTTRESLIQSAPGN